MTAPSASASPWTITATAGAPRAVSPPAATVTYMLSAVSAARMALLQCVGILTRIHISEGAPAPHPITVIIAARRYPPFVPIADASMCAAAVRQSIDLDVGGLYDGCPFLRLRSNEGREVLR